ncbi:hypothetical protein BDV96DRAFT_652466 [Lophiotrema nucula]|uniref:Uncharacterized protein n=1 Tax=Lophiotrema nucula TaxID=690887 RepID=A0A6A5YR23_9PLEO|nr:hypothetical protein BDV96DRAFT_652466 [Lophiotrema nucula]
MNALRERVQARQDGKQQQAADVRFVSSKQHAELQREKADLEMKLAELEQQLNLERRTVAERDGELNVAMTAYAELEAQTENLSSEVANGRLDLERSETERELLWAQVKETQAELETERLAAETSNWKAARKVQDLNAEIDLCSGTIEAAMTASLHYKKSVPKDFGVLNDEPGLPNGFLEKLDAEVKHNTAAWKFVQQLLETGLYSMRGRRVELDDNGRTENIYGFLGLDETLNELDIAAPPPMQQILKKTLSGCYMQPEKFSRQIIALERCIRNEVYDRLDAEDAEEQCFRAQHAAQERKRSAEEHDSQPNAKKTKLSGSESEDASIEDTDTEDEDEVEESEYERITHLQDDSYEAFIQETFPCDANNEAEMDNYDRVSAFEDGEHEPMTDPDYSEDAVGFEKLRHWIRDSSEQLQEGYEYNSEFGDQEVVDTPPTLRH